MDRHLLSRRNVLIGSAFGAGLLVLPGLTRSARADLRRDAPARRLLVLDFLGGMRTSATFLTSPEKKYNPWGVLSGSPLPLGNVLHDAETRAPLSKAWKGLAAPSLADALSVLSLVGTWDEQRGDHVRAMAVEATGEEAEASGILVRALAGLSKHEARVTMPAFALTSQSRFGVGVGDDARHGAVQLVGPEALPRSGAHILEVEQAAGRGWSRSEVMRSRFDDHLRGRRSGFAKELGEAFLAHRRAAHTVAPILLAPWMNVSSIAHQGVTYGSVRLGNNEVALSNAMLGELFASTLSADAGADPAAHPLFRTSVNLGLAVRLLQAGSPAVGVEVGDLANGILFDLHSGEKDIGPVLYRAVGKMLGALAWLLAKMPDPEVPSKTLLDTTLVFTITDFGRDPGSPETGFNQGDGSDHGLSPACYYVSHAILGGGTVPGRILGGVETSGSNAYRADRAREKFSIRNLLSTGLWALGLDSANPDWGFRDAPPITPLFS